jgi:hypothetical protein
LKTDFRGGFARPAAPATKNNVGEAILTQKEAFGWSGIQKGLNPMQGGHSG